MPKRNDTSPWERQEGESVKAFEAFTIYLEMGDERSQQAVSRKLAKSRQLISRWSATYRWVERVAAYEADVQRKAHAAAVKKAQKMSERHISIALKLQDKALAALKEMKPQDIDPRVLVTMLREATKLERENRAEVVRDTNPNKDSTEGLSTLADVISEAWEPVLGALSTEGAKLLLCGNPTKITGFFYDSFHKSRELYNTIHVDGRDSSRVDHEFVAKITDMFGEDSDVFRVRVAGDFPRALPDSFIPMEWAERASEAQTPAIERAERVDIGVDVARYGDDSSVLSPVLDKKVQEQPEIYHHNDTMELTGKTVQLIKKYARLQPWAEVHVKIDCDGLGVGVYDRLCELKDQIIDEVKARRSEQYADAEPDNKPPDFTLEIVECHFGGEGGTVSDDDPIEYQNSTGVMWGAVREALRVRSIKLWPDDKQISQLSNRKYTVNSAGKIELERKEAMKKRGLSSPDMGDALALALYDPLLPTWSLI